MAVLQGEQARQVMARMAWRANQGQVSGAEKSVPQPVADAVALLRQKDDAKRACA